MAAKQLEAYETRTGRTFRIWLDDTKTVPDPDKPSRRIPDPDYVLEETYGLDVDLDLIAVELQAKIKAWEAQQAVTVLARDMLSAGGGQRRTHGG